MHRRTARMAALTASVLALFSTLSSSTYIPVGTATERLPLRSVAFEDATMATNGRQRPLAITGHYGEHAWDGYAKLKEEEEEAARKYPGAKPIRAGLPMLDGDGSNAIRLWTSTSNSATAPLKPAVVHVNPEDDDEYCPVTLTSAFVTPNLFMESMSSGAVKPSYTGLVNATVATRMTFRVPSWEHDHQYKGKRCDVVFSLPFKYRIPQARRAYNVRDTGGVVEFQVAEPNSDDSGRLWRLGEGKRALLASGMCPEEGGYVTVKLLSSEKTEWVAGELWWKQPWSVCPVGAYLVAS